MGLRPVLAALSAGGDDVTARVRAGLYTEAERQDAYAKGWADAKAVHGDRLDPARLARAMYDADQRCSGIPGECCAPSTHADAESIAAAYLTQEMSR